MSPVCRWIVLTALVLAVALPVFAQTPPPGSYQLTCKDISVSGTTLKATCKWKGAYVAPSTLGYAAGCVGDIANVRGNLACTGANGSFSETCKDARVENRTLFAQCRNKAGQYVPTSLPDFIGFDHNISNCDGKLQNGPCS